MDRRRWHPSGVEGPEVPANPAIRRGATARPVRCTGRRCAGTTSSGHGAAWKRTRYWPTRRRVLNIRGEYNPKSLRREKTIVDKRPIYWAIAFLVMLVAPLLVPSDYENSLLTAAAIFAIYGAINLCWTLIIGTAGIYSLASYAVVGAGAYGRPTSRSMGLPWWSPPMVGRSSAGLRHHHRHPATRLDGFYYALLTLGLVELCRVYIIQSREFGSATGGSTGRHLYSGGGSTSSSARLLRRLA